MIIVIAVIIAICTGGGAWIAYLLHRDGRSWHPGDPVPDVPPDAPLRTWQSPRKMTALKTSSSGHDAPVQVGF